MPRNVVLIAAILFSLSVLMTSGASAMPTQTATILPGDCKLQAGEELPLTLDGKLPSNAEVQWNVDKGGITSVLPGSNAILIAPAEPMVITVTVSISPSIPGMETTITRQCVVTGVNSAPRGMAQATQKSIS